MTQVSRRKLSPDTQKRIYEIFVNCIKKVHSSDEAISFLDDLLSPTEKTMIAKRIAIALVLLQGNQTYDNISEILKVSRGTVARVNITLNYKGEGYKKILNQIQKEKALKNMLSELTEALTPLPPKGANWKRWRKSREEAKRKRQEPL